MSRSSIVAGMIAVAVTAIAADARAEEPVYTLFAGGDTSLARWVPQAVYQQGPERSFGSVKELVEGADIALANLERVVSTKGDFYDKGERRPYLYRAPPDMLDVLTIPGFDVVAVGNNHSLDYGPVALLDELELLDAVNIAAFGAGENMAAALEPAYVQVGELTVAFIGGEDTFDVWKAGPDKPGVAHIAPSEMVQTLRPVIAEARKHAHLVVFSPHWGPNWTREPDEERIEVAHGMIDAGVDAILGHSSHHIHGVEVYRGHPIVYDMGSLYFDTIKEQDMRYSAGFVLSFDANGFSRLDIHPFLLASNQTNPANPKAREQITSWLKERSEALDPDVAFTEEDGRLVLEFTPETPRPAPTAPPPRAHRTGTTRTLPAELRVPPEGIVLDRPPEWCASDPSEVIEPGVRVLCARTAEAVRVRAGFVTDVVVEVVSPPPEGRWEAEVRGTRRGGKERFSWVHPFADGAWIPEKWEVGQILVERSLARPPKLEPGTWDLTWRMVNFAARGKPVSTEIPIGTIEVLKSGVPKGPAGASWDGKLPGVAEREVSVPVGGGRAAVMPAWGVALAVTGGLGLLGLVGLWWRRRTRG